MRQLWEFPGGIHPPENKQQSTGRPIRPATLPERLVIPLQQHMGAPARVRVAVGDRVLKGEVIAEADGPLSLPVHATSSGEVLAIAPLPVPHPSGLADWCVILAPDGDDTWTQLTPCEEPAALPPDEVRARIRAAGIAGLGGAGFPTDLKLAVGDRLIDTLILNGAECEPYITADDCLMRERAGEIIAGLQIMARVLNPAQCLIGIEDNKPEAIQAMTEACRGSDIEVVTIPTRYPSGGEKQLIRILTGREVPHGGLPADIGVVCQNVGTAAAVYRAVRYGEPLVSRITTVTGEAVTEPGNFEVTIGTPVAHLLALAGAQEPRLQRLILGGPLMGFTLGDASVPVIKTSNCILAATAEELPPPSPAQACIRCGLCAEACPMALLPQQLFWFARAQEWDKAEQHNLFDCIECGACAYVCPSSIPLVHYYRHAKGEIRAQRLEQDKASQARARFEARQARQLQEQAEKEARRQARAEAAAQAKSAPGPEASEPAADSRAAKAAAVRAALARKQADKAGRKGSDRVGAGTDPALAHELETAQATLNQLEARRADGVTDDSLDRAIDAARLRVQSAQHALERARDGH